MNAVSNFDLQKPDTSIGSVLTYTCNTNYIPVGEMRCQSNGTWTRFSCDKGVYYYYCFKILSVTGSNNGEHASSTASYFGPSWVSVQKQINFTKVTSTVICKDCKTSNNFLNKIEKTEFFAFLPNYIRLCLCVCVCEPTIISHLEKYIYEKQHQRALDGVNKKETACQ